MSAPALILWLAALAVGFASAWRNPTALALVLAFAASQAGLPLEKYIYSDVAVIAIIIAKRQRSQADWFVMLCYLLAWRSYVFDAPLSYDQWWNLFWVAIAQFFAVGFEALETFLRASPARSGRHSPPDIMAMVPASPVLVRVGDGGDG